MRLHLLVLLNEVVKFFLHSKVITSWVKGVNIYGVEPNQILQTMSQAYLRRNRGSLVKVIHDLIRLEMVMINILGLQRPFEIETRRLNVLILHPASLLESSLDVTIASISNEDLRTGLQSVLLSPLLDIGDVKEHFLDLHVSLQEALQPLRIQLLVRTP